MNHFTRPRLNLRVDLFILDNWMGSQGFDVVICIHRLWRPSPEDFMAVDLIFVTTFHFEP